MKQLIFLLALTTAFAQDRLSAPPRVGVGLSQTKLTLQQAIELALKQNLEIEIETQNTAGAAQALRGTRGYYDPNFRWLPSFETRNTPSGSVLQGAGGKLSEHFHSENFSFHQKTPFSGASLDAIFDNSRISSSNPFASLSPFTTSRLVLAFTQPLFRGRETDRERTEIKVRRKEVVLSSIQFKLKAIDVVTRVEQAYWDLVGARQDVTVKADNVELARQQFARTRRQVDAGTQAPVEISAAEAELERRRDTWYASIGVVTEAENILKSMIAGRRDAQLWGDEIIPVEDQLLPTPHLDLPGNVALAIKQRPELSVFTAQQEITGVQRKLLADVMKPQVNLVAAYTTTGLGGTVRPGDNPLTASNAALYERVNTLSARQGIAPIVPASFGTLPDNLIGGYGATLSSLLAQRYPSAQVGIQVDFTFRNSKAEADLAQNAIQSRRLKLQQAQAEQLIEVQVRNAMQALETARQRIAAAEASVRAAKEKLESEERLYQTGESTNFLVLTRQNEYADSRHRLLVAKLDSNKAIARLENALGSTLKEHRITLQ